MHKPFIAALALSLSMSVVPCYTAYAGISCQSDLDNDQHTDVADLLMLINAWGPCSGPCPEDIAPSGTTIGDGSVDVADLLMIINRWGPCDCRPELGCVQATTLWCEDWETGNYSRWTGGYSSGAACRSSGFATDRSHSPNRSHRSEVFCTSAESHRGYGGLRFQGDNLVQSFTIPSTEGTSAPHGVIVQFWVWLDVSYPFSPTKWLSLMTATHDCSNNWNQVVTVNLDDSTRRLKPVHVSTVSYAPNAPAMPLQQWVRVTVYLNMGAGSMHVWQNGTKVVSATFSRPDSRICQWHWGLYASGNNDDIIMYEDDIKILKLQQPLTNFTIEPWTIDGGVGCP